MKLVNLTQHVATPEQTTAGVVEPLNKKSVQVLLTFDPLASPGEVESRAEDLADVAVTNQATHAMICGFGPLSEPLEQALRRRGIVPLHSFGVCVVTENSNEKGEITKTTIFRHEGFVEGQTKQCPVLSKKQRKKLGQLLSRIVLTAITCPDQDNSCGFDIG